MFNFLVTAQLGAWDAGHYEYPRDRFCEYTSEALKVRYELLTPRAIKELKALPTLFAYEGTQEDLRIGYVTRISDRGNSVYIEFAFESEIPPIPFAKLDPLRRSLDLAQRWEQNRTHWAIKNEDLLALLSTAGLVDARFVKPRLDARAFVLAAVEASVFALPDAPGLTEDELVAIAAKFDYKRGEISDAFELLQHNHELQLVDGRYVFRQERALQLLSFAFNSADDLRDPSAFEAVHLYFRELAREHGIRSAHATRDDVLDHVVYADKVERNAAKSAVTVFLRAGHLEFGKDSRLKLVTGHENWMLPSEQLRSATIFYRGRPRLDEVASEITVTVTRANEPDEVDTNEDAYNVDRDGVQLDLDSLELDVREVPFTVSTILQKIKKGQLILTPAFQRRQVWKVTQQSQFVEALLLNYPLPPLFLNQDKEGRYLVIDGLQRTSTLQSFCQNGFELEGLERLPRLNGKSWNGLPPDLHSRIEDKTLHCYVLKPTVPLRVINDIFARINSGGTHLNRQEIRHALNQGSATRLLDELAKDPTYHDWVGSLLNPRRMGDLEAVLRCIAFARVDPDKAYRDDMDEFLVRTMRELNAASAAAERTRIAGEFGRVWPTARTILGNEAFRLATKSTRGRINLAIMESVYRFLATHESTWLTRNEAKIAANYRALLSREDYLGCVRYATGDRRRVTTRFRIAAQQLEAGCA